MGTQRVQAFEILLGDSRRLPELRWINLAGEVPPVAGSNRQLAVVFDGVYYPVRNVVEQWIFHVESSGVGRLKMGSFCVKPQNLTRYHWNTGRLERLKEGKPRDSPLEDKRMLIFAVLKKHNIN